MVLKMNLKNVEALFFVSFFFSYINWIRRLALVFEIFGKNFSVLYHWILFIACLHDNIRVSMR